LNGFSDHGAGKETDTLAKTTGDAESANIALTVRSGVRLFFRLAIAGHDSFLLRMGIVDRMAVLPAP
jgi:hypothetical protein